MFVIKSTRSCAMFGFRHRSSVATFGTVALGAQRALPGRSPLWTWMRSWASSGIRGRWKLPARKCYRRKPCRAKDCMGDRAE
eukprot:7913715-Alexandrium_andersonii.AAC.1